MEPQHFFTGMSLPGGGAVHALRQFRAPFRVALPGVPAGVFGQVEAFFL